MLSIDATALLRPVSEEVPCGEDLEYDAALGELERAAQGTPARHRGEDEIAPAREPDWQEVLEKSLALFERTKDLRVTVHLIHAGLKVAGLPAFSEGLSLLRRLLEAYWQFVYPRLDETDNDDPTLRMNTLLQLAGRTTRADQPGLVTSLSRCALVQSRTLGRVTMRDIRIASGEIAPAAEDSAAPLDAAHIDATFLDCDPTELSTNAGAVRNALEELSSVTNYLQQQVGAAQAPDLGPLEAELRAMHRVLSEQLARRGVGGAQEVGAASAAAAEGGSAVAGSLEIRSRDDVVRILDRICEYFRQNEPSSPVPLLLQRAKGLVAKDFMEILSDLTPDAVSQAKSIVGADKNQ